jgi:tetratricopeptide (TPR) repeat protein
MKYLICTLPILFFYQNVIAQDGNDLISLGNKEMNDRNYIKADYYYSLALTKEPQNWNIYTLLGFSKHKQQKYQEADSLYSITIQNDSNSSRAHWNKGLNYIRLKKDSLCIKHYKKFIQLERNNRPSGLTDAYKQVGIAYERILRKNGLTSGQIDDMLFHLSQLELMDPYLPEVPLINNFIEKIKRLRPKNQNGLWILTE